MTELFRLFGIRGPNKGPNGAREKYAMLVKRLLGTEILIIIDQAHRLSGAAIHFLCELWNDTNAPQLWLGTEDLVSKLARDPQWASRLHATFPISTEKDQVRELVKHQIKSRLPEVNGEMAALTHLCERLAHAGNFRSVENHLALMAYLKESPANKAATWSDLFEDASFYLAESATGN